MFGTLDRGSRKPMAFICVTRAAHSEGNRLAERLAEKLGCKCLSMEDLAEEAIKDGIQVGKLEMAMVKPGAFTERMAIEREHYQAFITARLCDLIREDGYVFHGRSAHLVLPGASRILRVRVLAGQEQRTRAAMERLGLDRPKAQRYLEGVDEDVRRWVHAMHGVSFEEASKSGMGFDLTQMSVDSAADALCGVAKQPDFEMDAAAKRTIENLGLAARARVLLARDERTQASCFKVRSDNGVVTVTYLPQDAGGTEYISEILKPLAGIREVHATMATGNILWIQEKYDSQSETFSQVMEIATKWNASVEVSRLAPESDLHHADSTDAQANVPEKEAGSRTYDGGIEDDTEEPARDDGGLSQTVGELSRLGRSGGGRVIYGGQQHLAESLDPAVRYDLVVVGDVFLDKSHAARMRMARDLRSYVGDHIKAPVVTADELGTQYLFGKRDALRLVGFLAATLCVYYLVYANQEAVLRFLMEPGWKSRTLAALCVFLFVPLVAYLYGTVAKMFLKLIKVE